ncbi:hypothetical protein Tco_0891555 [Tanacetum coccineum]|uniref:Uncharacterized protein n=1 Tax=Tanacetum coccineum TaxID=301880 RepID=A0ABQ5C6L3_9ASTR
MNKTGDSLVFVQAQNLQGIIYVFGNEGSGAFIFIIKDATCFLTVPLYSGGVFKGIGSCRDPLSRYRNQYRKAFSVHLGEGNPLSSGRRVLLSLKGQWYLPSLWEVGEASSYKGVSRQSLWREAHGLSIEKTRRLLVGEGDSLLRYSEVPDLRKRKSGKTAKFFRRPTAKGVGLRLADSHTGNHPEDDFTPLETIRRLCSVFGRRSYLGFKGETSKPKGMLERLMLSKMRSKTYQKRDKASVEGPIPPKTTKQRLARKNEVKAKSTLLLAIPDEHILKFQKLICQLEIHGEVISQEDSNLKLLRSLPLAWNNIALIMRNKSDLDTISIDDLYNNLKVYEAEIKSQSSSSSNSQNVAFVSLENTSSTNEAVNTAYEVSTASSQGQASSLTYADDVMISFFVNQSNSPQLDNEDLNAGHQGIKGIQMEMLQEGLYHSPYIGNYMPSRLDLSFAGLDDSVYKTNVSKTIISVPRNETTASKSSKDRLEQPKDVRPSAPIIEE